MEQITGQMNCTIPIDTEYSIKQISTESEMSN